MKKLLAIAATLLLTTGILSAQEFKPVVKTGAKSLNFTFGGIGSFGIGGSGINGGLGASYFASQDVAYRIGFQAGYNRSKNPWTDYSLDGTNPGADGSSSQTNISASFDYLMFMDGISQRVRPYWGPGLTAAYQSSDVKNSVANNAPTGTVLETKHNSNLDGLTFGVSTVLGAEFFIYPELSLSAEYKLTLFSLTSRSNSTTIIKNLSDRTTKQGSSVQVLGVGAAGATLHIYF